MKISNNLLIVFQKIPQKYLNFAKVWLSFHTIEFFLHCEDENNVLMRVAQNVLQVIGLVSKHLTELVECFFNEISTQNDIFTEKAYGSEEALRSLQFTDIERLCQGGELQKKVDSELKKRKS